MMETLREFLNRKIILFLKNGYCHRGTLLEVATDFFVIDDRYKGRMVISRELVGTITIQDGEE